MILKTTYFVVVFLALFVSQVFALEGDISILQCESNAIANRDYYFNKKEWVDKHDNPSKEFGTGSKATSRDLILRNKVFARLNTNKPVIKSITPPTKYVNEEQIVEFEGSIVDRNNDIVTITWKNPENKIWFATINLKYKKAIVSYVYEGATSFGVDVETLDCK